MMGRAAGNKVHASAAMRDGEAADEASRRIQAFFAERTTMRDSCGASMGIHNEVNVFIPDDLAHLYPEIEALSQVPVFFQNTNRMMHLPDVPISEYRQEFDQAEAAREAETEFVFGAVSASDGLQVVVVSLMCDWRDRQCMSDGYSEVQEALIAKAFAECGLEVGELSESSYELDGASAAEARSALQGVAGFIYDPAFEQTHSW